jgi:hypothetical protein
LLFAAADAARDPPTIRWSLRVAERHYENRNVGGFRDPFRTPEVLAAHNPHDRSQLVGALLDTAQVLDGPADYEPTTCSLVASMWPALPDAFYARGARLIADDYDEGRYRAHAGFVAALAHDPRPWRDAAWLLLGIALAARCADVTAVASSALERALAREDVALGSRVLGDLLATELLVTSRWTKAFAEVSALSSAHRDGLRTLVVGWLESGRAKYVGRDLGKLLEILHEGCVQDCVAISGGARAFLAGITGASKTARVAKRLLAVAGG